jgi:hypothetical protein
MIEITNAYDINQKTIVNKGLGLLAHALHVPASF